MSSRLPACALFDEVAEVTRQRFEAALTRRRLDCGEHLWWAGEAADHVTIIERGFIQIVRTAGSGETSVVGIIGRGDAVGLAAALEDAMTYPADAVVVSGSAEVARVSAAEVRSAMAVDPALGAALQTALINHTSVLLAKVCVVGAGSVAARLATLFVHLADRFGTKEPGQERTTVPVVLPRATLAGFVEARVETVIRTMSIWRRSGVIRTTDTGFDVDHAALAALAAAG